MPGSLKWMAAFWFSVAATAATFYSAHPLAGWLMLPTQVAHCLKTRAGPVLLHECGLVMIPIMLHAGVGYCSSEAQLGHRAAQCWPQIGHRGVC